MVAKRGPECMEKRNPKSQYDILELTRIGVFVNSAKGTGRPTKKDRRSMEDFTEPTLYDDGFDFYFDSADE